MPGPKDSHPVNWGHFRSVCLRWGSETPWPGAASVPAQALGALCLLLSSTQGIMKSEPSGRITRGRKKLSQSRTDKTHWLLVQGETQPDKEEKSQIVTIPPPITPQRPVVQHSSQKRDKN